ncbi:MAG: pilus assembly protein PilM [Opitutaceae bacterium]|jgi:type IV pilus assembly protein PilM|nr:pilus assembly protein PilM [Opitutaceae bacterium]
MSNQRISVVDCASGHAACGVFSREASGALTLEKLAFKPFAADPLAEGSWEAALPEALEAAVREAGVSGPVVISVPGHQTLTKFIKIPSVDEARRGKIIQFEAQQNIPYPLNEVVWDYLAIADDQTETETMLAAVKTDVMEAVCAAVRRAGASPVAVLPTTLSLLRSFRENYPDAADPTLVVNIGARSTNLLFAEGGRFFIRTLSLSGDNVSSQIAAEVKHDFAAAETLKISVLSGRSDLPETSPARLAVLNAVQSFAGRLHLEITRSVVGYRRQGGSQPARVLLTGGGSLPPGLGETLSAKLKLPVERFDPLRKVALAPGAADARQSADSLADLVGLAARRQAPGGRRFTLLPPSVAGELRFAARRPFLFAAAVCLVAALALPVWSLARRAAAVESETRAVAGRLAEPRRVNKANRELLARIDTAKAGVLAIEQLAASRSNWINFLGDLQKRLCAAEDVWLERLQVVRAAAPARPPAAGQAAARPELRLTLSGRLLDRDNPLSNVSRKSEEKVGTLLREFAASPFVQRVEDTRFDNKQPGILRFDFTLILNPAKPL